MSLHWVEIPTRMQYTVNVNMYVNMQIRKYMNAYANNR